jgi:hypothetical protein
LDRSGRSGTERWPSLPPDLAACCVRAPGCTRLATWTSHASRHPPLLQNSSVPTSDRSAIASVRPGQQRARARPGDNSSAPSLASRHTEASRCSSAIRKRAAEHCSNGRSNSWITGPISLSCPTTRTVHCLSITASRIHAQPHHGCSKNWCNGTVATAFFAITSVSMAATWLGKPGEPQLCWY